MHRLPTVPPQMRLLLLLFILPVLLSDRLLEADAAAPAPTAALGVGTHEPPFVGVNIGTAASNMLSASDLVSFLKSQQITHIRLYEPDADLLSALNGTHIRVAVGVPNNQLLALGSSPATAAKWVARYITPYFPTTLINFVTVGDEVVTSFPSSAPLLVPAMQLLHDALSAAGVGNQIKISTPLSASVILDPFPPSQAFFNQSLVASFLLPLLRFLSNASSPLMLNLYPYYVFMQNRGVVPLDNALFKPLPPSKEEVDLDTLLHYTNVLDAMVDAAYFSMKNLNVTAVPVLVAETGWPSRADAKAEPYATPDYAATYNSNLIRRVLVDRPGTPLRPDSTPSVYIYELFNEDLRPGPLSEANWGLFNTNGTPAYLLHVSGAGGLLANDTTNRTFCVVAETTTDLRTLQAALDWACGPGRADCSGIQPGQQCYEPNNVRSHASFAFDSYYQKQGQAAGSCYFQGAAMVTTTDPSHGRCVFPGSKVLDNRSSSGAVISNTAQTSNAIHAKSYWFLRTAVRLSKRESEMCAHIISILSLLVVVASIILT